MMEYSIWIVPKTNLYSDLANIISHLAKKFSAPIFIPHITLLGDITTGIDELFSLSAKLASLIEPFDVSLTSFGQSNRYFYCVFLNIEKKKELITAHIMARNIFRREDDQEYEPHISLLYGNFPKTVRDGIIKELKPSFEQKFLLVDEINIVYSSTRISPVEWKILDSIKLSGP